MLTPLSGIGTKTAPSPLCKPVVDDVNAMRSLSGISAQIKLESSARQQDMIWFFNTVFSRVDAAKEMLGDRSWAKEKVILSTQLPTFRLTRDFLRRYYPNALYGDGGNTMVQFIHLLDAQVRARFFNDAFVPLYWVCFAIRLYVNKEIIDVVNKAIGDGKALSSLFTDYTTKVNQLTYSALTSAIKGYVGDGSLPYDEKVVTKVSPSFVKQFNIDVLVRNAIVGVFQDGSQLLAAMNNMSQSYVNTINAITNISSLTADEYKKSMNTSFQARIADLASSVQMLKAQEVALQSKLSSLQANKDAEIAKIKSDAKAHIDAMNTQLKTLETKKKDAQAELERIKSMTLAEIQAYVKEKSLSTYTSAINAITKLQNNVITLPTTLVAARQALDKGSLQSYVQSTIVSIEKQIASTQSKLLTLKDEAARKLADSTSTCNAQIADALAKRSAAEAELARLTAKKTSYQNDTNAFAAELAARKAAWASQLQSMNERLTSTQSQYASRLSVLRTNADAWKAKMASDESQWKQRIADALAQFQATQLAMLETEKKLVEESITAFQNASTTITQRVSAIKSLVSTRFTPFSQSVAKTLAVAKQTILFSGVPASFCVAQLAAQSVAETKTPRDAISALCTRLASAEQSVLRSQLEGSLPTSVESWQTGNWTSKFGVQMQSQWASLAYLNPSSSAPPDLFAMLLSSTRTADSIAKATQLLATTYSAKSMLGSYYDTAMLNAQTTATFAQMNQDLVSTTQQRIETYLTQMFESRQAEIESAQNTWCDAFQAGLAEWATKIEDDLRASMRAQMDAEDARIAKVVAANQTMLQGMDATLQQALEAQKKESESLAAQMQAWLDDQNAAQTQFFAEMDTLLNGYLKERDAMVEQIASLQSMLDSLTSSMTVDDAYMVTSLDKELEALSAQRASYTKAMAQIVDEQEAAAMATLETQHASAVSDAQSQILAMQSQAESALFTYQASLVSTASEVAQMYQAKLEAYQASITAQMQQDEKEASVQLNAYQAECEKVIEDGYATMRANLEAEMKQINAKVEAYEAQREATIKAFEAKMAKSASELFAKAKSELTQMAEDFRVWAEQLRDETVRQVDRTVVLASAEAKTRFEGAMNGYVEWMSATRSEFLAKTETRLVASDESFDALLSDEVQSEAIQFAAYCAIPCVFLALFAYLTTRKSRPRKTR